MGTSRKSRTARTKASGWVWWAAWRAPSMTTMRPSREPGVEGLGRGPEDRQARPAEDLQDRLADRPEPIERGGRVGLGLELAQDRAGGGRPRRPDRVRPIRGEVRRRHPDDLGHERREGAVPIAGARAARAGAPRCPPGGSSRRRAWARPRSDTTRPIESVSSAAPSAERPPYEWPTTSTGRPASVGQRVGDRGDVLELALDGVRAACRPRRPGRVDPSRGRSAGRRASGRRHGTSCGRRSCRGRG